MKILRGRAFTEADTGSSPRVAIVNETMAERLWPHQDALGQRFRLGSSEGPFKSESPGGSVPWLTVVGVVREAKLQGLLDAPGNFFYVPQTQNYRSAHVLQLRTSVPPQSLIVPAEALVRELDPNLPVYDVMTMEQAVAGANGYFLFKVGAAFAGVVGWLLACSWRWWACTVWCLMAASQRGHEIGIRMALGAQRVTIFRLVVGQAVLLVGLGIVLGAVAALGTSRLLASLLVGVSSYDPITFAVVSAILMAVALLACYLPARQATKVDPMTALKYE